jgi:hypothetical protein
MAFPFRVSAFKPSAQAKTSRSFWDRLFRTRPKKVATPPDAPTIRMDALEPRYLLSADLMPFSVDLNAGTAYALRYENLTQSVQLLDRASGTVLQQRLAQQIDYVQVTGSAGDDSLTVDFGAAFLEPLELRFDGAGGSDTLELVGDTVDAVTISASGVQAGAVTVEDSAGRQHLMQFTGVSLVRDALGAAERVFADDTGAGQALHLQDIGTAGDGLSALGAAGGLVSYEFAAPTVALTIAMGAGDDTLAYDGADNAVLGKVVVQGGGGTDAITGPPQARVTWNVTGADAGDVAGLAFSGVENLRGAADNEDTFVVHGAAHVTGVLDGGAGGFDSMVFEGGSFGSVAYVAFDAHSGTVTRDGVTILYDGLEPITDNTNTTDRIIDLSAFSDSATLTQTGADQFTVGWADPFGVITFETVAFSKPSNSLTIRLGEDEGIPVLSRDELTIGGTVDLSGVDLVIDGQDGTDNVIITGTLTVRNLTIDAENVTISGTVNAGAIDIEAAAGGASDGDGEITGGVIFASASTSIDLTGATINATGAVTLSATSTAKILQTQFTLGAVEGALVVAAPDAAIVFSGTTLSAASLVATARAAVDVSAKDETDASDTGAANQDKDVAISSVTVLSSSAVSVGAGSSLTVAGGITLAAQTELDIVATADGGAEGSAVGATLAVMVANPETRASVAGGSTLAAGAAGIAISATLDSSIATLAVSTAGGADDSGGSSQSAQRLADPNDDGDTSDQASTSGGSISFAGAVAISVYTPTTEAFVNGATLTTTGALALSATATETVSVKADGSKTSSSGTGVGVGVALGFVTGETLAWVGGTTSLTASSVALSAVLHADNTYTAEAVSGSGDGAETGVAGAFALQVIRNDVTAALRSGAAVSIGNNAGVTLTATSATKAVTTAMPDTVGAASELGIGASVALLVAETVTSAVIEDTANLAGAGALALNATGTHVDATTAKGGTSGGGTAIGGAFALAVTDNTTVAEIGTGDALAVGGAVTISATHAGESTLLASGDAVGGETAIGAAIALGFIDNRSSATTKRNTSATGAVLISASAKGANKVEAKASAAGADKTSDSSADSQKQKQIDLLNDKSGKTNTADKSGDGAGSSSASDGNGNVGVAAALAVSSADTVASARLDGVTVSGSSVALVSTAEMDAAAIADGSAATGAGATSVGVAVAINLADVVNEAVFGTGTTVTATGAGGVSATAGMTPDGDVHNFEASATSGASRGDTGVAGSFALNISDSRTLAEIASGATVNAGAGKVTLSATSTTLTEVAAKAVADAGKTGAGISIAINAAENLTDARLAGTLGGGNDVELIGAGAHDTNTEARSGATSTDGTGVGGSFALAIVDNVTRATVTTGAALGITDDLTLSAQATGRAETLADGDATAGGNAAIGAAIALAFVDDVAEATTARNVTADGSVQLTAETRASSIATAKASAKGADKNQDADKGATADEQKGKAKDLANAKSGKDDQPDSKSSATDGGSSVSVAASLALNFSDAVAKAAILTGTVDAESVALASRAQGDGKAIADSKATDGNAGATAVGIAVAINIAGVTNEAIFAAGTTTTATTGGISASATMLGGDPTPTHDFQAKAISGASGGDTGVAGSFALNISETDTQAAIASGATVNAGTGNVTLTAASKTASDVEARATSDGGKTGVGVSIGINIADNETQARVDGVLAGGAAMTMTATGTHGATTTVASGGKAKNGTGVGGSFSLAVVDNLTRAAIASAMTPIGLSGALTMSATGQGTTTTFADGDALGSGTAVGAAIALAFVDDIAEATTARSITAGGAVSLTAVSEGSSITTAEASAEGAAKDQGADKGTTADQQKGKATDLANAKSGKSDGTDATKTSAKDGEGGSVSVAASLAVNVSDAVARAAILAGTVNAASAALTSRAQGDGKAIADSKATNPASGSTGVGIAVAINVAGVTNEALFGAGTTTVTTGGASARALMTAGAGDKSEFAAKATSGASGGDTGVAGSFALNISETRTRGAIVSGASVDGGTGDITLAATAVTDAQVEAKATTDGGKTGVGVSIGINVADNLTRARADGTLTGGDDVTLTATGTHGADTKATSGAKAKNGTGVGGAVAIAVIDNVTEAVLGTGNALDITGTLTATATNTGISTTEAAGDALGDSVAVGAAIALAFVDDSALAATARNITADGSVTLSAVGGGSSAVTAKASAAGADKSEEQGKGNGTADAQRDKQVGLANQKSGKTNDGAKSASSEGGGSSGDKVSVAAAIALNVQSSKAVASINDGRTIIAGQVGTGVVSVASSNNMDAQTTATGEAKQTGGGSDAVGVAVAVNVGFLTNQAIIGAGTTITADGVQAQATMRALGGNSIHGFGASATSGASAGDVGVAGSFALSYLENDTRASIGFDRADQAGSGAADVNLTGGGASLLTATSTTATTVVATSKAAGGGSGTGVGASIGIGIALNDVVAEIEAGTDMSGTTSGLAVTATSTDTMTNTATAGAQGGTAVGGGIAISYIENDTLARIGAGAGGSIALSGGTLGAVASHTGTVTTTADGEAGGSDTAVGLSLALNIATTNTDALVARSFNNAGAINVLATSNLTAAATSKASAKGNQTDKSQGSGDSDAEVSKASGLAGNQRGGTAKAPTQNGSSAVGQANGQSGANGGGSTGSGGTSVAATIAFNWTDLTNKATVAPNVTLVGTGAARVEAIGKAATSAEATATSTNAQADTGVAAAVAVNVALLEHTALVDDDASITGASVAVKAGTQGADANSFKVRALSGGVANKDAIAGSIAVNVIDLETTAKADADARLNATAGNVAIEATSRNNIQNIAGGAALSLSSGTGVGLAVAVNVISGFDTTAAIGVGADVDATGAVSVIATAALNPTSESVPVLGTVGLTSFAAGVAASVSGGAGGGSSSVNVIFIDTAAYVDDLAAVTAGSNLTVRATDQVTLFTAAGGIGATVSGNAGVGIGIDVTVFDRDTLAWVGNRADLEATSGNVVVEATSVENVTSIAASFGLSVSSGPGVSGSVVVQVLLTETRAYVEGGIVGDRTEVTAGGDVTIRADADLTALLLAGGVAFSGGGAGFGIASTVLVHTDTVEATVGDSVLVTSAGTNGVLVSATSFEDIVTIAAAGAGSGSSAAVAGSVVVNVLIENTRATIGSNAEVRAQSASALTSPDVAVYAESETDIIAVAGSLAISGGSAGVGAGVNVHTIEKDTKAAIQSGTTVRADGNVTVEAESDEDVKSFSVAAGGGSSVGVTVAADVHVLTLTTRAFIGDDPADGVANAGLTDVRALGSVLVQAVDETELDLLVGGVSVGGSAGIGASVGVAVVNKTTEGFIGAGARVTGEGNKTVEARTGRYGVNFVDANTVGNVDPQNGRPTKAGMDIGKPGLVGNQFSDLDQNASNGSEAEQDPGLTKKRVATATTDTGFRGVAVSATTKDDIATFALSVGGGGSVGVSVGAAVNVVNVTTRATIGQDARINQDPGAPGAGNAGQSVLVAAASDFNHVGVGAGLAVGGSGAGAPGVDVSILTVTTEAAIGQGVIVDVKNDVDVIATAKEKVLIVSAGLAVGGTVGVAGGVSVMSLTSTTTAGIGINADIEAGGDVAVMASDDTATTIVSGAVGVGGAAAGAAGAVGVVNIDKSTSALIGDGAQIDAKGLGAGAVTGVLTGDELGATGQASAFTKGAARGVVVQAESSETVLHIAIAGGVGLYAGVAGGVSVTLIDSDTTAAIGANANINQRSGDWRSNSVGLEQGVHVGAANRTVVTSFAGSLGVGFVGLAGAVDFGSIKNDVTARIGDGADVSARGKVEVNALSVKQLTGFTFSASGGVVGLGASVSVWSIGDKFSDSYEDSEANSGNALKGSGGSDASTHAGSQSADGTSTVANMLSGDDSYEADGDPNSASSRVAGNLAATKTKLNDAKLDNAKLTTLLGDTPPTERGVTATIGNGGSVDAGGDVSVAARERVDIDMLLGNLAGGLVGVGAAISVMTVSSQVRAKAGGAITAGGEVAVVAEGRRDYEVLSVALQAGFVGLGASVVVLNDDSRTSAEIVDNASVDGASAINVTATTVGDYEATTRGIQAGAVAVGASYVQLDVNDGDTATYETQARIGQNVEIGQTAAVGNVIVTASSTIDAEVDVFALAAGIGAATINFGYATITPQVDASIGSGTKIKATGVLTVEAKTSHDAIGDLFSVSVGALAAGSSVTTIKVSPTVTALVGSNATIEANGVNIIANHNFNGETPLERGARANAEGAGAALVSATVTAPTAEASASVSAGVGGGTTINGTSGVVTVQARSRNLALSDANALSIGLAAAFGLSLSDAKAEGSTTASMGGSVTGGAGMTVGATARTKVRSEADSSGGGFLSGQIARADASATPTVKAEIADNGGAIVTGDAKVIADSTGEAYAETFSVSGGFVGIGSIRGEATLSPVVTARIGKNADIEAGSLTVEAKHNAGSSQQAFAKSQAAAVAFGGSGQFTKADADANAVVLAEVDQGVGTDIGGTMLVRAFAQNRSQTIADGTNIGILVAIGETDATSISNGSATARIVGNASVGDALIETGNLTVEADIASRATARAIAAGGGLISASDNESTATANPTATANVGSVDAVNPSIVTGRANILAGGNVRVAAVARPEGDSRTTGVTFGGVDVGASLALTNVNPEVAASVFGGSVMSAGGNVTVEAVAEPPSQNAPNYQIVAASPDSDPVDPPNSIQIDNHGLTTGDLVEYAPGTNTPISGLDGPTIEFRTDPGGNNLPASVNRQYGVLNVLDADGVADPNLLRLGASFQGTS